MLVLNLTRSNAIVLDIPANQAPQTVRIVLAENNAAGVTQARLGLDADQNIGIGRENRAPNPQNDARTA